MENKELKKEYAVICTCNKYPDKPFLVWNGTKRYCKTLEEAKRVLKDDRWRRYLNRPTVVNGLGISTEDAGYEYTYHIEVRYVSAWEIVEE